MISTVSCGQLIRLNHSRRLAADFYICDWPSLLPGHLRFLGQRNLEQCQH